MLVVNENLFRKGSFITFDCLRQDSLKVFYGKAVVLEKIVSDIFVLCSGECGRIEIEFY